MAKTTSIAKYNINDKSVYLKIIYNSNEDNLFEIKIYEDGNCWSGEYSYEMAKKSRERVLETEEEYYDNVVKGLSKHKDFYHNFTIATDDNNAATFSWQKKLGSAVLVHGSVLLHRDVDTKDTLLDILILENQELKNKLNSVNIKNKELGQDLEKCVKSLDSAAQMKQASEELLYSKFGQLLNSKKRRIKLLEENISKFSKLN